MNQMNQSIELIYSMLDQSSSYMSKQFDKSYLDALIDSAEQLFQQEMLIDMNAEQAAKLQEIYDSFNEEAYSKEEMRRGFQLAVLKGMKEMYTLPGAGVTADSVVMFVGYLAQKFLSAARGSSSEQDKPLVICDPAVGAANLLTGVCNALGIPTIGIGAEVDPTMVRLAYVNTNLQQHETELFHQDGLKPLFTDQCDMIVCDLPIGIYPNDKVAQTYELYKEDEVYTHHLFIEQAIRHVKAGGYMFFVIPNTLFSEPGADKLRAYITNQAHIQALLQLPSDLFQKGSIQKSIFILQKKGEQVKRPDQTLLAQLPPFSNQNRIIDKLQQINEWIQKEKGG
ncbi:class I SAM-dependent methyltransferase [Bacillus horti]|uniref:Site-specific DNA-methyltransferase (Adenine-specific) n=1 Tax=Caldalkalibacillus horti TaxID=77523 RepID=A0ABT9W4G2_9BACI|nr:class I SAM-dependent methyltransferase [Bacillus horti]MDQ0168119.1 site-specific DNA-methyltransferase (adenine-specific) [Bacillus horti]